MTRNGKPLPPVGSTKNGVCRKKHIRKAWMPAFQKRVLFRSGTSPWRRSAFLAGWGGLKTTSMTGKTLPQTFVPFTRSLTSAARALPGAAGRYERTRNQRTLTLLLTTPRFMSVTAGSFTAWCRAMARKSPRGCISIRCKACYCSLCPARCL